MITIENWEVLGWEHAIRGMRNPMNSWDKSDTTRGGMFKEACIIGPNDIGLMKKLAAGGSVHAKYRRMITVYLDVTAPLYWWKEADTYWVGKAQNSCSTMHKIHAKEFELADFSHEHLLKDTDYILGEDGVFGLSALKDMIIVLNHARKSFLKTHDKRYWWQMIQLLPSSYNQRRTLMLNYENLSAIYRDRRDHKLDEWREFCKWIEKLPYSDLITMKEG